MTQKKKTPAKAVATPDLSLVDEDGFLCLKGDRLWKWRALEAALRAAQAEMDSVQQRLQIEVAKNPELPPLFAKKIELANNISMAKTEVLALQAEIEKVFGVSLTECAFDDKTGRLYNLNDAGDRGEPVKASAVKRSSKKTSAPKGK